MFFCPELLFAEHRWPALKGFVISGFPTGIIGPDAEERIDIESEICSVGKQNADAVSVLCWFDFYGFHDLSSHFGEVGLCAPLA